MTKISGSTVYFKRVFPAVWFGFLAFFILIGLISDSGGILKFGVPIFMGIFGYFLFKKLVWDLADEVYDCGNQLIFRKGNLEQTVALTEIINVNHSDMSSPERITLTVRNEGKLGTELTFTPPIRFNPFSKSELVSELIRRIDEARK